MRGQDLLTALADELKGLAPELAPAYDAGSGPAGHDAYVTSVSRLSEAAGYMGLAGVQRIAACVLDNLRAPRRRRPGRARAGAAASSPTGRSCSKRTCATPPSPAPIESLIAHFGGGWVPLPLDEAALSELRAELAAASGIGAALDETEQAAPEALEAADLALDISNDVDAALLDAFLHDSPPQAAEVTQSLQGWIADPTQSELLRNAKRAAHTLKGSANILGIRGVAKLAHRLEDILEICETESAPPSSMRAQALMSAADCLEQMVATVAGEDSRARTTRSASSNCSTPRATTTRRTRCASACSTRRRPPRRLARLPHPAPAPARARSQGDDARAHASCSTTWCAWWASSRSRSASSTRN